MRIAKKNRTDTPALRPEVVDGLSDPRPRPFDILKILKDKGEVLLRLLIEVAMLPCCL